MSKNGSDSNVVELAQARLNRARKNAGVERSDYEHIGGSLAEFQRIADEAMAARAADPEGFERYRQEQLEQIRFKLEADRVSWARDGSGIPHKILNQILSGEIDPEMDPCVAAIGAVEASHRLIGLLGPTWVGKTSGACFALYQRRLESDRARLEEGVSRPKPDGRFITAPQLARVPTWELDNHWAMWIGFLVLDDIGREPEDKRQVVEEVLMQRYDHDFTTIFTGNLTDEEFCNAYDERVVSRIKRVGELIELTASFEPGGEG